jgi:DegV family protein with EDD domain
MIFVVDRLGYLHRGGRCSASQALMGSLLKIHPVLQTQPDGTLGVREKIRGSRRKIMHAMLNHFQQELPRIDRRRIIVAHADAPNEAHLLRSEVEKLAAPQAVPVAQAGCVISSHCGPGTLGLQYLLN